MFRPTRRSFVTVLVVLPSLLVVPVGAVAAQGNPNAPYREEVDVSFAAPNLTRECGFPVTAHVYGTLTIKAHPSRADRVQVRYMHAFGGPGGSVSVNRVENAWITITVLENGTEIEYLTATGQLMYHNVLPGVGSIGNNSGREVFEVTWRYDEETGKWIEVGFESYHDSGPNNGFSDDEWKLLCSKLG